MKYKNYKSAIHNFTHSFISIDYMKSSHLAINILIDLYNIGLDSKATFDFVNNTINPTKGESLESKQLMKDYLDWLPEHFKNHNCDLTKLEKLEVIIWTDFKNTLPYQGNKKDRILKVSAVTKWKANGRNQEIIELIQSEKITRIRQNTEKN